MPEESIDRGIFCISWPARLPVTMETQREIVLGLMCERFVERIKDDSRSHGNSKAVRTYSTQTGKKQTEKYL